MATAKKKNTTRQIEVEPSQDGRITMVVENLTKHFKHRGEVIKALDGVSFSVKEKQFVAITGPSGCGKSTLLYLLGGLDKPTDGTLMIDDIDVGRLRGTAENRFRRQKVGFVFQSFHLVPNLTALENVMLPMELAGGVRKDERRERATKLLNQVGIDPKRHNLRPGRLSGGMQQRVAVARSLANDPTIVLADEPTGNLDSQNGRRIIEILRDVAHRGRTVIVVTHDPAIAKKADIRIPMLDGKIQSLTSVLDLEDDE